MPSLTPNEMGELRKNPFVVGYFGQVFVRLNVLEKVGDFDEGETHDYDHVTLLSHGAFGLQWEKDDKSESGLTEFVSPQIVIIKKNYRHKMIARAPGTVWWCIHAMRDIDGDVSDIFTDDMNPYG